MKKTVFFQKIIDSRFFAKWKDDETKTKEMEIEIQKRIDELVNKFEWLTEYCKHSWIFKVWIAIPWKLETDEWSIQYRCNFHVCPKKEVTYNTVYAIANSIWNASSFKFL